MKKIITAIGNEEININLKKYNDILILSKDIQYREGIIEILENNNDVDFIIINTLIQGEISIKELIDKINEINKKIKIIIILNEENINFENYLISKKIFKIIKNTQYKITDLLETINDNKNDSINRVNNEKNIISKKQRKIGFFLNILDRNKKYKKEREEKNVDNNLNYPHKNKIINITGPNGVGKSVISVYLSIINSYSKNKILVIDFNLNNYSISTILGTKKIHMKDNEKIFNNVIKVNKKISLILGEFLLNSENEIDNMKMNILKENFNLIIIDISPNNKEKHLKYLYNISDFNLFLSDTNFLEISKSIYLLNILINKYKINKNKFNIIFNKYNNESINLKLLEKIFSEFEIIGHLNFNKHYNRLINKNKKNFIGERKIRKEINLINNKINNKSNSVICQ